MVEKIHRGKKAVMKQPLFPGYIFINLCKLNDNWHAIRSTRGVAANRPLFKEGMPVAIIDGPLKDLNAVFCRADGEERAIILLNLLNRQQHLRVPLRALVATN
jgi:transcriptional antiterminator RfaH